MAPQLLVRIHETQNHKKGSQHMDFQQALNATAPGNKLCKFATWLADQDPDLEAQMRQAIPEVNMQRMHRAVKIMGFEGSPDIVRRHLLNEGCACR